MSRRKLKTPALPENNAYRLSCGVFTLMALTGRGHLSVSKKIREHNYRWKKDQAINGMYTSEMIRALRVYGLRTTVSMYRKPKPTLAKWLSDRRGEEIHHCYIIALTSHFVLINGNEFIDTYTKTPVKIDDCPHRRARVEDVIKIN